MAKIMNINYESMPGLAKQMREQGKDLNAEMVTAYQSIADMHKSWYGQRYNSLVKEFNKLAPELNELLELVVGEIPFVLETIANNYAQADRGSNVTSAGKEAPKKISTLTESNEVGMKFITAEVGTIQANVSNNFRRAKEKMDTIESEYEKIQWESEAAEAFRAKFKRIKANVIKAFEDIDSQFTKLMEQTKQDIQNTESANTVNA